MSFIFIYRHVQVRAASTMNQSDIRGLACMQARADRDILRPERTAFFGREFSKTTAYHIG